VGGVLKKNRTSFLSIRWQKKQSTRKKRTIVVTGKEGWVDVPPIGGKQGGRRVFFRPCGASKKLTKKSKTSTSFTTMRRKKRKTSTRRGL